MPAGITTDRMPAAVGRVSPTARTRAVAIASKKNDEAGWAAAQKGGHLVAGLAKDRWPMGTWKLPMVPLDNSEHSNIPMLGSDGTYLSEKGLSAIASQITRITAHSALHYHIKQLRKTRPDVDIILIEPSRHDYKMFFYNAMRYSARLILARHGFESVTLNIAEDYAHYKTLLGRHGVSITRRVLLQELHALQHDGAIAAMKTEPLCGSRHVSSGAHRLRCLQQRHGGIEHAVDEAFYRLVFLKWVAERANAASRPVPGALASAPI